MTTAQHGGAGSQGELSGAQPPGNRFASPAGPPWPQTPGDFHPPAAPPGNYAPPPPRRNRAMGIAVATAILLATAALVVAIVDLTRSSVRGGTAVSGPATSAATAAPKDFTAANRALCTAIAPLMTDSNRVAKAFSSSGPAGSPERDAATGTFVSETRDWAARFQPVIDSHPDADPYLRRSLQRFVDDRRYLVADLEAGPWQPYDQTNWNDSLSALGAPLSICWDLGVKW